MKVTVVSRSGVEIIKGGLELAEMATVADLQHAIHSRIEKLYPSRQRLTLPLPPHSSKDQKPIVLNSNKFLKDYSDGNISNHKITVVLKDLGPQISYKMLYFFEYLGPLLLYPLFYYGYKTEPVILPVKTYALYCWCVHFIKRIMETLFVHRFSHATAPIFPNLVRNCAAYYFFSCYIGYSVNHLLYTPASDAQMKIGFGISIVCQISNLYCHILLRNLRSKDRSGGYQIPRGFLFNYVTCANYTTEFYQWLGFSIATQTVAGYLWAMVGAVVMTPAALARHRRLEKLFDGKDGRPKYARPWAIFPPFL